MEDYLLPCFFVKFFHIECPGCGTQRAFMALLNGELMSSVKLYPALMPYMFTLLLLLLQLKFQWCSGGKAVMWSFIISIAIMVVSYLIKLV
jgi:hypothetical protein